MLHQSADKVTIITVVYNAETVIGNTIKNVLAQNYPNLEYIVIDGNSSDKTTTIVKSYEAQISSWFSEPDKGVYDAMNKGINKATGEWILFMNAGDYFYSTSSVTELMSADIDYNNYSAIYGDAEFRLKNIAYINEASDVVDTNQYMPFSHQAVLTRASVAKQTMFDLTYKIAADAAFFLQLVKKGHSFKHLPVVVCSYNALEGLSADNEVKRSKEIVALQAKWNKINQTEKHFTNYIRNAKIKQWIRKITPSCLWIYVRERSVKKRYKRITKIG